MVCFQEQSLQVDILVHHFEHHSCNFGVQVLRQHWLPNYGNGKVKHWSVGSNLMGTAFSPKQRIAYSYLVLNVVVLKCVHLFLS